MKVGIPREVKNHEYRVAITPSGVHELTENGHDVVVEKDAGVGSQISDDDYVAAGARILGSADDVWGEADMVLKVKEPVAEEYHRMREGLTLFTYLHLAADKPLTEELVERKVTGIAYETVQLPSGALPLLYPMSEVAGCLAPQVGAHALMRAQGGRGVLMGGVGGVANAKVVILGAGVSGQNAANIALGMGADVTLLDTDLDKLRMSFWRYENQVHGLASSGSPSSSRCWRPTWSSAPCSSPVRPPPSSSPTSWSSQMKPGSVLVDIAIDQGGCFEDSHATTHADPTYRVHDSVFYCVANMPGAVPNTSTYALTNSTLPYAVKLANQGWRDALRVRPRARPRPQHARRARHLRRRRRGPRHGVGQPRRGAVLTDQVVTGPPAAPLSRLERDVRGWLDHVRVERGASDNTLTSYARDLRAYTAFLAAQGHRRRRPGHRGRRHRLPRVAARARSGRLLRGPHARGGPRLPPLPRARGRGGR